MNAAYKNTKQIILFTLLCLVIMQGCIKNSNSANNSTDESYKDASLSIEARADLLLAEMTIEEKVAQLETVWQQTAPLVDDNKAFIASEAEKLLTHGIGHIARPSEGKSIEQTIAFTNDAQRWLVEETRLGIPAIFHEEALHGHAAVNATSFPQAIAMASTFDTQLIHDIYQASSREVRARGGNQALTPILDIARDPRWGRIEETMGEDTYLVTELGVAAVKGFQGDFTSENTPIPKDRVLATLKHLTGHGQPTAGLNIAPAPMGERELREVFLPPFEAAIKLAKVRNIMASYNEIDGIPSHANKFLLTDILRDEWQFKGVLVSDYFAINELVERHNLAGNKENAAMMALRAGVDVEMPDRDTFPLLVDLVKSGSLDIRYVDTAVKRVLTEKFRLGLFENPYTDLKQKSIINSQAHKDLALSAAEKSMVLLKNNGLLPLSPDKYKKVAVIGPHADETLLGGYSNVPAQTVTILDGIKAKLGNKAEVKHALGTLITKDVPDVSEQAKRVKSFSMKRWTYDEIELADDSDKEGLFEQAIELAKNSDIAIVVVGSNEGTSREAWADQHLGDRTDITLLGDQQALVEAVLALGKPTVVMLYNGRPLVLGDRINKEAPAIVEAWYLGEATGTAVANVLFGDVNPSGKLPLTFPREVGQVPFFYNHKPSARRGYAFSDMSPQYPFGHGLSYTSFDYSNLKIDASNAKLNGNVTISFSLKNSGELFGSEVAQLYIRDTFASVTRPVIELKGFKRVALEPGETAKVSFDMPANLLAYYDQSMDFVLDSGEIQVKIGSSSADIRLEDTFEVSQGGVVTSENKAFLTKASIAR